MPKAAGLKKKKNKGVEHHPEAKGLVFIGISFMVLLCLMSYVHGHVEHNWLGLVGHLIAFGLHYIFGLGSYLVAAYLMWIGWRQVKIRGYQGVGIKSFYFLICLLSLCVILNVLAETKWWNFGFLCEKVYSEKATIFSPLPVQYIRHNIGGVPFYYLYRDLPNFNLQALLSDIGVFVTFSMITLVAFFLLTDLSFFRLIKRVYHCIPIAFDFIVQLIRASMLKLKKFAVRSKKEKKNFFKEPIAETYTPPYTKNSTKTRFYEKPKAPPQNELKYIPMKTSAKNKIAVETFIASQDQPKPEPRTSLRVKGYNLPPMSLLTETKPVDQTGLTKELRRRAEILEETLLSFGIEAKVGHIHCGPTITSFEVHPAIGVKVQKIKALENDIALNLKAHSIRIIAPIPGKAAVGVEVPSIYPQEVGFKEMLSTSYQAGHKHAIPILLGKTVRGEDVICDLSKMPHCIIAGATGSGKSVCINTIIMSILMTLSPEEVRLLLVDPKKVELTPFSRLPHLIAPVITEPKGAYAALQWLVKEMGHRYEIFKKLGLRNITSFNKRKIDEAFEESFEMEIPKHMHYIVAIIDEFADLMMTAGTDLETPIARIAQMARAVGIHLILATQRPSREVITGIIKANFPTRISFKVSSRINSQIILDENGAESLLGNGDMLFLPPGTSELIRCQGVYVRDADITEVVHHITSRNPTNYLFQSFDDLAEEEVELEEIDKTSDALYDKALQLVLTHKTASTTFIQRKLKIGYARAASLIDALETNQVIGPADGSRPRKIL